MTSNTDLIQKKQSDYFDDFIFENLLRFEFLNEFVKTLLEIDKKIKEYFGEEGTRWFGRETTLVGFFAAAGKVFKEQNTQNPEDSLTETRIRILNNPGILQLKEFEKERNSLDLAKINIGTINKRAVFNGVYDVLTNKIEVITWSNYFKSGDNE